MCLDKKSNDLDMEIHVIKIIRKYLVNIVHMPNGLPTKLKSNIAKFILNIINVLEKSKSKYWFWESSTANFEKMLPNINSL